MDHRRRFPLEGIGLFGALALLVYLGFNVLGLFLVYQWWMG